MFAELNRTEVGQGSVSVEGDRATLCLKGASSKHYSDAQLDDTRQRSRGQYRWDPPVRFSVSACFSDDRDGLRGTAGFGFWNVPFGPEQTRIPALPRAIWFFFGSPPHNVPLALGVSGSGWKASCLDAGRPSALLWAPLAPVALLALRSDAIYRRLWPHIQRALGVNECEIHVDMCQWHHYEIDWARTGATFCVDGRVVLAAPISPRGPLGFVAWIDNQYAIATPRGRFGWGLLDIHEAQWLAIKDLTIC